MKLLQKLIILKISTAEKHTTQTKLYQGRVVFMAQKPTCQWQTDAR